MSRAQTIQRCAVAMRRHAITPEELQACLAKLPAIVPKQPTKRATMQQLAARPQGVSTREVAAACETSFQSALKELGALQAATRLHRITVPGHPIRWFTSPAAAQAWADSPAAAAPPKAAKPAPTPAPREANPSYTPVDIKQRTFRLQGKTIIPKGVKRTMLPAATHDVRYQVAPGQHVPGAGFAAAGIGIDPSTGKPWAR